MPRKGGGKRGFMKGARRAAGGGSDGSGDEEPEVLPASKDAPMEQQPNGTAEQPQLTGFEADAPSAAPQGDASGRGDGGAASPRGADGEASAEPGETRGRMLQRHKRVRRGRDCVQVLVRVGGPACGQELAAMHRGCSHRGISRLPYADHSNTHHVATLACCSGRELGRCDAAVTCKHLAHACGALSAAKEEPGMCAQELKELKDAAKRAGKKGKDEFRAKEADMQQRHDRELAALDSGAGAGAGDAETVSAAGDGDASSVAASAAGGKVRAGPLRACGALECVGRVCAMPQSAQASDRARAGI